jgi:AcrR family transcriptional regulator
VPPCACRTGRALAPIRAGGIWDGSLMGQTRRTKGLQRGPRSQHVLETVRAATLAELARVGVHGLTIDGVAKAANVSRTTIYRRWPSKMDLLTAVVEPTLQRYDDDRDTGSLESDLLLLLLQVRDTIERPEGRALTALGLAVGLPEVAAINTHVRDRTFAAFHRAFDRARARGEVAATDDVAAIVHLAVYGVLNWERAHAAAPTEEDCRRILRVLLAAVG